MKKFRFILFFFKEFKIFDLKDFVFRFLIITKKSIPSFGIFLRIKLFSKNLFIYFEFPCNCTNFRISVLYGLGTGKRYGRRRLFIITSLRYFWINIDPAWSDQGTRATMSGKNEIWDFEVTLVFILVSAEFDFYITLRMRNNRFNSLWWLFWSKKCLLQKPVF